MAVAFLDHGFVVIDRTDQAIGAEQGGVCAKAHGAAFGVGFGAMLDLVAAGFGAVVASCGTSLTPEHVKLIAGLSSNIVVNFDPDAPGAKAAERSIDLLLEEGMHVRIMELDAGLDPDEYCKERGAEAYHERLTGANSFFYWLADRARKKFDVHTPDGKVAILQFLTILQLLFAILTTLLILQLSTIPVKVFSGVLSLTFSYNSY